MKYVLIIGDGMADNPVPELFGKTPLEYAAIPALDALASAGTVGSVRTIPVGVTPGSDTAILSIFGCDPSVCYSGRAPLEAAADGIAISPGDAAYRCNIVTVEDTDAPLEQKRIVSHSAGAIEGEESAAVIRALFDDARFRAAAERAGITVYPAQTYRHIAVQKNADIRGLLTNGPHDHIGAVAGPLMPSGCDNAATLRELMLLAHEVLQHHPINDRRRADGKVPANCIWFWAEGTAVKLPNFFDNYKKTGGVISAVPLCHGIAALTGLEPVRVDGATGELDTNYEGKVDAALRVLEDRDFAAVHLEAPDECTHAGDLKGKIEAIERLDQRIIAPLIAGIRARGEDFRMLVLSDHKTLTATRGHDGTPVPYIIYDSRIDKKTGAAYCESVCERGEFIDDGVSLMSRLFEAL